jgi:diacylglycerol kinase (ATP)
MKKENPKGFKRIYLAFFNTLRGFNWLLKNEAAFQQEIFLASCLTAMTYFLDVTASEQIILIIALLFILLIEIINTAIEVTIDRIGLEHNTLSGLAKDLGSAAVFISFAITLCVWGAILWR